MFCLGCGYDLHALTVHRCPECGRVFDPNTPGTYLLAPRVHTGTWRFVLLIAALFVTLISAVLVRWLGVLVAIIQVTMILAVVAIGLVKRPPAR